jgi:hypothetical protein
LITEKPKNLLLQAARIVGRGFLLGVGLSISLVILVLIAQGVSSHRMAEQADTRQDLPQAEHDSYKLEVLGRD